MVKWVFLLVAVVGAENIPPLQLPQQDSTQIVRTDSTHLPPPTPVFLKRTDTVSVEKHQFNHREQIITGGVIMACLMGMLAIMNNYNPR